MSLELLLSIIIMIILIIENDGDAHKTTKQWCWVKTIWDYIDTIRHYTNTTNTLRDYTNTSMRLPQY